MKQLLKAILLLLTAFSLATQAATVTLTWDPMPAGQSWKQVRIYERIGTAAPYTYTKVAEVAMPATSVTVSDVSPGVHTYVARSADGWESADSNAVNTPPAPNPPKLTVTVTVNP